MRGFLFWIIHTLEPIPNPNPNLTFSPGLLQAGTVTATNVGDTDSNSDGLDDMDEWTKKGELNTPTQRRSAECPQATSPYAPVC